MDSIRSYQPEDTELAEHSSLNVFEGIFSSKQKDAEQIIKQVYKSALDALSTAAVEAPLFQESSVRYVVQTTPEIEEALAQGILKFDVNKKGEMFAQFREKNGDFGSKVPIKEELIENGIDPCDAANALQLQSIQQTLESVVQTLESISSDISRVLQGQYNDRLGLYYSGRNLYLEAREVEDEQLRKLLASQAIRSLSDASCQMKLTLQDDIKFLLDDDRKRPRGKREKENAECIASMNNCFQALHNADIFKAAIYFDLGETNAMLKTFEEYSEFIGTFIAPHALQIAECDVADTVLTGGVWERRAASIAEIGQVREKLKNAHVFYLEA